MLTLFQGIRPVKRAAAMRDALSGVVFAAMDIPQALGYTRIAGMPVVTGLYSLLLPAIAFAIFGSSRYLVVAADSATAAILRSSITGMAPAASARYVALASLVALLTAAFLVLSRILKLGFIADFLSQPVLAGFLTGVGLQVGIAVLGQMVGVEYTSRQTLAQLYEVFRNLPHVQPETLLLSIASVGSLILFDRFVPRIPGPLFIVVIAIAASAIGNFAGHGISTIGPVTGGLPHIAIPDVSWNDVPPLISAALSCTIMILTQSAATSRIFAARHHQHLEVDQDIVGLAAANVAAGVSGTFVVNGSPTQTAMVEGAGSQSQLAQVTAAIVVAIVLLFLTHPLQYLPRCVLGALVFMVAIRMVKLRSLQAISKESPQEYLLAITTALFVVAVGVEQGIILAMLISLFRIVHHNYHPVSGVMVKAADGTWALTPPVPDARTRPGFVMYRFEAALFYANASRFSDEILTVVGPAPTDIRWLIVDAESIPNVDYTAARVIEELKATLDTAGVTLGFTRLLGNTRSDFDRHHLTECVGTSLIFSHIHDAVVAYEKLHPTTA